MRLLLLLISVFSIHLGFAQLALKPLPKKSENPKLTRGTAEIETNTLPFWEDFSRPISFADSIQVINGDTTRQWNYFSSRNVFVNPTLAINPPSLGVATFDGLDSLGQFHGAETGLADSLVSAAIDLSGFIEANDIFFSFYWQAGGNVEVPDQGDSLVLQFYNELADTLQGVPWSTVWLQDGGSMLSDSTFTQEAIRIQQRFLNERFIFRFLSFGDLDGPFDAWHVDWIYINSNRAQDDFYYEDQAFNQALTSPFAPFQSIPLNQLTQTTGIISTAVANLRPFEPIGFPASYVLTLRERVTNTIVVSEQLFGGPFLELNPDPLELIEQTFITFDNIDLSSLPTIDSAVLEASVAFQSSDDDFLDDTPFNMQVNDVVCNEYLLQNFYAYDDGSAEYAVGTNVQGGQVGVQFWLDQPDTLTHVDIYFPNIEPSSDGRPLTIRIFRNLTDQNPLRSQPIVIETAQSIDSFSRYELDNSVILSDTFYVTYQQSIGEYIGIGFDRSNVAAAPFIFDNPEGDWIRNDRLEGALMIRPVFGQDTSFVTSVPIVKEEFKVYPNPSEGTIYIEGAYDEIQLVDLSGKTWATEPAGGHHDFSRLPSGLYLLAIRRGQTKTTTKLILR